MDDFTNIIKRYPQVQRKMKDNSDKNIELPPNYQSTVGYDTLIQNVILKEKICLMGTIIVDTDTKIKFLLVE